MADDAASTDPLVAEREVRELYARVVDFMEALQFCIPTKGQEDNLRSPEAARYYATQLLGIARRLEEASRGKIEGLRAAGDSPLDSARASLGYFLGYFLDLMASWGWSPYWLMLPGKDERPVRRPRSEIYRFMPGVAEKLDEDCRQYLKATRPSVGDDPAYEAAYEYRRLANLNESWFVRLPKRTISNNLILISIMRRLRASIAELPASYTATQADAGARALEEEPAVEGTDCTPGEDHLSPQVVKYIKAVERTGKRISGEELARELGQARPNKNALLCAKHQGYIDHERGYGYYRTSKPLPARYRDDPEVTS